MEDLVGIPFVSKGRDKSGADCWGVFKMAQERFGNYVPDVTVDAFDTEGIVREMTNQIRLWTRVEDPLPGDAVVMAHDPNIPEIIQHYGVYIGGGKMIHTIEKIGSMIVRIDHPLWKNKIRGFYRWNR